jgi:hypothetical protein
MMRCSKCGSIDESHVCAQPESANDNKPFNEREWRRAYMRRYMRQLRQKLKEAAQK